MLSRPSKSRRKAIGAAFAASAAAAGAFVAASIACSPFSSGGPAASGDATFADGVAPSADALPPPEGRATSCADVLARDPAIRGQSGKFTIDPDGAGAKPSVLVYCEMAIDDGGWTLVARSSMPAPSFGWEVPTGSVADVTPAYSLDIADAGLAFTEVLVADRDPYEFEPAAHAYRFAVPENFLRAYTNSPLAIDVKTVIGNCVIGGGPAGLRYAGYTALADHFFFGQDPGGDPGTGFHSDVFTMSASDCESGADLDRRQGVIFVR